jgi:uncharacterized protein YbaR (Trm112 family)
MTESRTPLISDQLLKLILCPITGAPLEIVGDLLVNEERGVSYPIKDGIPLLDPKYVIRTDNSRKQPKSTKIPKKDIF